ncbi:hypothetical protein BC829DRAFT_381408, partial [Chytridium lagenaria]
WTLNKTLTDTLPNNLNSKRATYSVYAQIVSTTNYSLFFITPSQPIFDSSFESVRTYRSPSISSLSLPFKVTPGPYSIRILTACACIDSPSSTSCPQACPPGLFPQDLATGLITISPDLPPSSSSLSIASIIGILVGCCIVIALLLVLAAFLVRRKKWDRLGARLRGESQKFHHHHQKRSSLPYVDMDKDHDFIVANTSNHHHATMSRGSLLQRAAGSSSSSSSTNTIVDNTAGQT